MANARKEHPKDRITLAEGTPEQEHIKSILYKLLSGHYGMWDFRNMASVHSVVARVSGEIVAVLAALRAEQDEETGKPRRGRQRDVLRPEETE